MTPKRAIGISPFELVYGTEANLPLLLELATSKLRTIIEDDIYKDALEKRILYLSKLEEERMEMVDHITQHQMQVKELFDKKTRPRKFMVGDMVLLWDKRKAPKGCIRSLILYGKVHSEFNRNLKIILSNRRMKMVKHYP